MLKPRPNSLKIPIGRSQSPASRAAEQIKLLRDDLKSASESLQKMKKSEENCRVELQKINIERQNLQKENNEIKQKLRQVNSCTSSTDFSANGKYVNQDYEECRQTPELGSALIGEIDKLRENCNKQAEAIRNCLQQMNTKREENISLYNQVSEAQSNLTSIRTSKIYNDSEILVTEKPFQKPQWNQQQQFRSTVHFPEEGSGFISPIQSRKCSLVPKLKLAADKLEEFSNYEVESELDFDNLLQEMNELQDQINLQEVQMRQVKRVEFNTKGLTRYEGRGIIGLFFAGIWISIIKMDQPLLGDSVPHEAIADVSKLLNKSQTEDQRSFSVQQQRDILRASDLAQPGGFRRHHLQTNAVKKGISYEMQPLEWKLSFVRKLESLSLFGLVNFGSQHYGQSEGNSDFFTYLSLVKSMVASGILYLPRGFLYGGWLFSILAFALLGFLSTITMIWLSKVRDYVQGGYVEIAEITLGRWGKIAAQISLTVTQFGFSILMAIFINSNMIQIMAYYGGPQTVFFHMGIFTIIVIPLCLVRKLHKLAFTHLIADLFMICALGYYLVISSIKVGEEGLAEGVEPANPQLCLMMIGMAIFSYEGFAMVLPIKEAMKDTKNFPYLVTAMMITCTSLLCAFGLLNYLAYGKSTEIIITLNYEKSYVTTGVLLLYVLSIILTYPMTLVPINIIIEQTLDMKLEWTYVSRIILVLCSVSSAIVLNDSADKYLSVLGAVFCAPVGFILPSLMYLYGVPHLSFFNKFMGVFMIVFGLASGSLATFVAIYNW